MKSIKDTIQKKWKKKRAEFFRKVEEEVDYGDDD